MNLSHVQTLRAHGVHMYVDPQTMRMRYRSPAGGLTLELAGMIAEVALQYEERAAIREHDAGIERAEAERLAAADVLGHPPHGSFPTPSALSPSPTPSFRNVLAFSL